MNINIKITEKDGLFQIWGTEGGTPSEPPIFTAHRRTGEQVQELLPVLLAQGMQKAAEKPAEPPKGSELTEAKRQALDALLAVLDDWIAGAHSNHEGMDHRGENIGSECWRQFAPADIRAMVNDAAREVGIPELPIIAREDSF